MNKIVNNNGFNLKPCPFCGSTNIGLVLDGHPLYKGKQAYTNYVHCNFCNAHGGAVMGIAAERWNKGHVKKKACAIWNERREQRVEIRIKYHHNELEKIEKKAIGDWVDLRAAATVRLKQGEFKLIPLGISMKLPEGYEANVVPRSSTFKNFGVIQTNSFGVIDSSYCGDDDQWFMPVYATRDTTIHFNDRICQFRINRVMEPVMFSETDFLEGENRGGHGSTGIR